jgi:hypothetical protein
MRTAVLVMIWIPAVLWLDRTATPTGQSSLAFLTWEMIIWLLVR